MTAATLEKIVSGGQTGVDRAALDAALQRGMPCGGWCPKGRRAEDGAIPDRYPLTETPARRYAQRTQWNVRDADGTLIITRGAISGGTKRTHEAARALGRPCLVVDLAESPNPEMIVRWLGEHGIRTLNIAGPRESQQPGIHNKARAQIDAVLDQITQTSRDSRS